MLGKLIKCEFKATWKFSTFVIGVFLVLSVLFSIGVKFNMSAWYESLNGLSHSMANTLVAGFIFLLVATGVLLYAYFVLQYKKKMFSSEGVMWRLIPVQQWKHLVVSTLISSFWLGIFAVLVYILGDEIVPGKLTYWQRYMIWSLNQDVYIGALLCYISYMVLDIVRNQLMFFVSVTVGYSFKKLKGFLSTCIYLFMFVANGVINFIFLVSSEELDIYAYKLFVGVVLMITILLLIGNRFLLKGNNK